MKSKININLLITFFQLILFLTIIYFFIKIIIWKKNSISDKLESQNLNNEVLIENIKKENVDILKTEENNTNNDDLYVDFNKLNKINTDIIAWIKIDNTNINYPILQSTDNDFYLHRNFKKEYSQAGSIFLNSNNNMFLDKNTIIYGHNMNDNTMFHELFNIYDNKLGNNIIINIYTQTDNLKYKVISSYIDIPENIKYNYDLNTLISKSNINYNIENINSEKLLTLYTCNFLGDKRLIINAAKVI